jgi:hypothetical protein
VDVEGRGEEVVGGATTMVPPPSIPSSLGNDDDDITPGDDVDWPSIIIGTGTGTMQLLSNGLVHVGLPLLLVFPWEEADEGGAVASLFMSSSFTFLDDLSRLHVAERMTLTLKT